MDVKTYLHDKIKLYYQNNPLRIDDLEKREFGYGEFGKKISGRHLAFKNNDELNDFLITKVPFYLSYSSAYYNKPDARPMSAKEYLGGDLIFEFDADDIPTDCKNRHDSWSCEKCGETGYGHIKICPKCNARTKISEWVCDECILETRNQMKRLYDLVINQLGFDQSNTHIMFSGHKGFHIKIKGNDVYDLKQYQRNELMDYISEEGINFNGLGFVEDNKGSIKYVGKKLGKGYDYLNKAVNLIEYAKLDDLIKWFDIKPKSAKKIYDNKVQIIDELKKGNFYKIKKDSVSLWFNFLETIKDQYKLFIDRQTTIDLNKIIRAENTIHGGAMLLSKVIPIEKLDYFNPFNDAFTYNEGFIKVHFKKVPKLILGNKEYGPYDGDEVELPTNIGLYFLAKGAADDFKL